MSFLETDKNYYAILGVAQACELSVIKAAFRKLAKQYHPDVSTHPLATSKFQEIAEAYEVLSKHRQDYDLIFQRLFASSDDETGQTTTQQAETTTKANTTEQAGNYWRQFNHWTANPHRGRDRNMVYPVTLKYAFKLLRERRFYIPSLRQYIPFDSSALNQKQYRFAGKGFPGIFGGPAGDYIISFKLNHHTPFKIRGGDLYMLLKVPQALWQSGGHIYFDTPSGLFKVNLPAKSKIGSYIRFKDKGLPADSYQNGGHLYAKITIE